MRKILVTGMSGTGKSTALAELGRLGFRVVDTDVGGWSEWSDAEDGYVWREDRMADLLARHEGPSVYVSGTVSNQGRFYDRFDAVVLARCRTARQRSDPASPHGFEDLRRKPHLGIFVM